MRRKDREGYHQGNPVLDGRAKAYTEFGLHLSTSNRLARSCANPQSSISYHSPRKMHIPMLLRLNATPHML